MAGAIGLACRLLRRVEPLRLEAWEYCDGVWKIGYGHVDHVRPGCVLTVEQAEELLVGDLLLAQDVLRHGVQMPLLDHQRAALMSFVSSVGSGSKGIKDGFLFLKKGGASGVRQCINLGEFDRAALQMKRWVVAGGHVRPDLEARREVEAGVLLGIINLNDGVQ